MFAHLLRQFRRILSDEVVPIHPFAAEHKSVIVVGHMILRAGGDRAFETLPGVGKASASHLRYPQRGVSRGQVRVELDRLLQILLAICAVEMEREVAEMV